MISTRSALGFSLIILLLSACTGTPSQRPDVLLILGYSDAAGGKVGLVRAETLCVGTGPACLEQRIIEGSEQLLPAPPVAYDIVDRGSSRRELAVLSRTGTTVNEPAFLSLFNIAGLDPINPEGFAPLPGRGPFALGPDLPRAPALATRTVDFCPAEVQLSADGRYAAVLNDNRGRCNSLASLDSIVILDLQDAARMVAVLDDQIVASSIYLAQGAESRLYSLQEVAQGVRIRETLVPSTLVPGTSAFVTRTVADIPLDTLINRVNDLDALGATLIALRNADFFAITSPASAPVVGEAVPAGLGTSRRLVVLDDPVRAAHVIVLGDNQVAVHETIADASPQSLTVSGVVSGTIDLTEFAYFAAPGTTGGVISTLDLIFYSPATPPRVDRFVIAGLGNPAFISWVQAELAPLPAP